ncbi:MAG TPA: GNAT family N-acetyltransferase [candidate division Zixibacteria bacterium]|nr:GNAT family N-acetyltransferase [candidate division Zixibacteria bacterium]
MSLEVKRFSKDLVGDFYHLHNQKKDAGWCFCVAWWIDGWDGWSDRTAGENRRARDELHTKGEYDGYLLYINNNPGGWCQVGPRDRLSKLAKQFELEPDPETWAITCFLIDPAYRRRGLASHLLIEILVDLKKLGIGRVEAFPRHGADIDEMDMWNGPESIFVQAGFTVVQEDSKRLVLAIDLSNFVL